MTASIKDRVRVSCGILFAALFGVATVILLCGGLFYTSLSLYDIPTKAEEEEDPLFGLWRVTLVIGVFLLNIAMIK